MLRIYDEVQLARRTRLKLLQIAILFASGAVCGGIWSASDLRLSELGTASAAHRPLVEASTASPVWCDAGAGLRLDCTLSVPELARAEGV